MKALVFGANGQDGFYLAQALHERGIDCVGVDRAGDMLHGDVADSAFVRHLIAEHMPARIFHLAARSTTHHDALFENHAAISTGSLNILEAVYREHLPSRILLCGSGVQFENDGTPISEETPFAATSPYAVARIHVAFAARYYRTLGIPVYVTSPNALSGRLNASMADHPSCSTLEISASRRNGHLPVMSSTAC
jgi:GDPmannose 4,6-dehydratase